MAGQRAAVAEKLVASAPPSAMPVVPPVELTVPSATLPPVPPWVRLMAWPAPVTSVSEMFSVPTEAPLSSMPTWPDALVVTMMPATVLPEASAMPWSVSRR